MDVNMHCMVYSDSTSDSNDVVVRCVVRGLVLVVFFHHHYLLVQLSLVMFLGFSVL